MPHSFHIVDVFTDRAYAGNPLAVVLDGAGLSSQRMQSIALEFGFSETTFVAANGPIPGAYPVRIFSPVEELPFAGHPTLGTAWVIWRNFATRGDQRLTLDLSVGEVVVHFEKRVVGEDIAWLEAPAAEFGSQVDPEQIAGALGLEPDEIDDRAPVQQVRIGISALVVPLREMASLRRAALDLGAFQAIARHGVPPFVYLFCSQTHDPKNDFCTRFFFQAQGVREDAATGSAAACLGAYLVRHQFLGRSELALRIEQGHEIGRPSLLYLNVDGSPSAPMVSVGGSVVETARGQLLPPTLVPSRRGPEPGR